MTSCFACEVNSGRIPTPGGPIYDDGIWVADHGVDPLLAGYVVFKPKRHVHELPDLTGAEAASFGPALQRVIGAMRSALGTERVYVCSFAETVHHLHLHLLPRYPGLPALGPDLVADVFAGRWACSEQEAIDAAERIREELRGTIVPSIVRYANH